MLIQVYNPQPVRKDHSIAGTTIERFGESGATHDSQSASRSGVEAWVERNLNGWDDSDAGVTAYSFPPRKRAPAHKFASEFVHHPRKWAPRCSFSRGTYPRICSPPPPPAKMCTMQINWSWTWLLCRAQSRQSSCTCWGDHRCLFSFFASLRYKPQGCRVQSDDIAAHDTKAWLIWLQ